MMRLQLPNKLTSEMKGAASLTEQILTLSGRPTDRRQAMSAFRGKADISWEKRRH
jgi:bacterioferritin (cytochrome b1)